MNFGVKKYIIMSDYNSNRNIIIKGVFLCQLLTQICQGIILIILI